jgi:hypothetical protein
LYIALELFIPLFLAKVLLKVLMYLILKILIDGPCGGLSILDKFFISQHLPFGLSSEMLFGNNNFLKVIRILAGKDMLVFKVLPGILELTVSCIIAKYSRVY